MQCIDMFDCCWNPEHVCLTEIKVRYIPSFISYLLLVLVANCRHVQLFKWPKTNDKPGQDHSEVQLLSDTTLS
jgi:hypothetical protein